MSTFSAGASIRRLRISRIAVVMLALASAYFVMHTISVMWGPGGGFGIEIDPGTAMVNDLDPRNAATGIRIGDRVDLAAMPFRERGYLYENLVKPAGWRMTVPVTRGSRHLIATFEVVNASHSLDDIIVAWLRKIAGALSIATGVILVWNRPSVMLWALAVYLIRTHDYIISPLWSPGIAALIILSHAFITR